MRPKRTLTPVETPCWPWPRARDGSGYGAVWRAGKVIGAHVYVYEALIGPIPDGLELDHLCCNHACVNPDHLEPVTHVINIRRRAWNRLTAEAVVEIRSAYAHGISMRDLGGVYGVNPETIRLAIREKTWAEAA